MGVFLRAVHRDLTSDYGAQIIGTLDEMHPLAAKMIEDCAPNRTDGDSRYMEFITILSDYLMRQGNPTSIETLKKRCSPQKFSEFMTSFALGMQFAARKVGGHVKADHYRFQHTLTDDGHGFESFRAASVDGGNENSGILIHPLYLAGDIMDGQSREPKPDGNKLTNREYFTLTGVEEMLHAYQTQRGMKPTYELGKLDLKQYDTDPMEQEADTLKTLAMQELRLGSKYRGPRR